MKIEMWEIERVIGHDRVHTLGEISTLLNLSKERIRQVQNGALNKLRLALEPAPSHVKAIPSRRHIAAEDLGTILPCRLGRGVQPAGGRAA